MKNPLFKKILQLLALIGLPLLSCAQKSLFEKAVFVSDSDTLPYRILYPDDFDKSKKYPLLLFLHGSGERGNDNEAQLRNGVDFFATSDNLKNFPAIVLVPQCPVEDYWSSVERTLDEKGNRKFNFSEELEPTPIMHLLTDFLEEYRLKPWIDLDRLYVGGLSMGGMGTFELLALRPDWFAAAFPICGGGDPESAVKYAGKTSLWIFHGEVDDVVPVVRSVEMADVINEAGGDARLTIYPGVGHASWINAFKEPELLQWVFSKRKKH